MTDDRERKVRERAYKIWQEEGEPHGKDVEHWHRAGREVEPTSSAEARPDAAETAEHVTAEPAPEASEKRKRARDSGKASGARRKTRSSGASATPAPAGQDNDAG